MGARGRELLGLRSRETRRRQEVAEERGGRGRGGAEVMGKESRSNGNRCRWRARECVFPGQAVKVAVCVRTRGARVCGCRAVTLLLRPSR